MPILWRYLLLSYFRTFALSISTFIAILLVSRFQEIARFTALVGSADQMARFTLMQIPLILPLAIPISALIASILLFQSLSRSFELTAIRASGVSLAAILTPLLLFSCLLSWLNFSICADLAPYCRRESRALLYRETSSNPLVLLQRQSLIPAKEIYFKMRMNENGTSARDVLFIIPNESHQRLSCLSAKRFQISGKELLGSDVSIISHLQGDPEEYDPLIIENQRSMATAAPVLSAALKKKSPHIEINGLSLRMLRIQSGEPGRLGKASYADIFRRIALSLSVFTFTFVGAIFGIEQGRNPSKRSLFTSLGLSLFLLISYFLGKGVKDSPFLVHSVFLLPHLATWIVCSVKWWRIERGFS